MDFLLELVIQFVVELVIDGLGEAIVEGTVEGGKKLVVTEWGRSLLLALAGFGFGCFWGDHLSGNAHYPRLLWVSSALGGLALLRLLAGRFPDRPATGPLGYVLTPPWSWQRGRVLGFLLLNAGLATGILLTFAAARPLA